MARRLPTTDYLHECLSYDPDTGLLTWKHRPLHHFKRPRDQASRNAQFGGKKAGSKGPRYIHFGIDGVTYLAHRVIWCMQTGEWPGPLDHKNRDGFDNSWKNLREATVQQNKWNRSRPYTGLPRGVRRSRKGPRFTAQIKRNHQAIHLGTFDTPEEAHEAWLEAARDERGEFFHAD